MYSLQMLHKKYRIPIGILHLVTLKEIENDYHWHLAVVTDERGSHRETGDKKDNSESHFLVKTEKQKPLSLQQQYGQGSPGICGFAYLRTRIQENLHITIEISLQNKHKKSVLRVQISLERNIEGNQKCDFGQDEKITFLYS